MKYIKIISFLMVICIAIITCDNFADNGSSGDNKSTLSIQNRSSSILTEISWNGVNFGNLTSGSNSDTIDVSELLHKSSGTASARIIFNIEGVTGRFETEQEIRVDNKENNTYFFYDDTSIKNLNTLISGTLNSFLYIPSQTQVELPSRSNVINRVINTLKSQINMGMTTMNIGPEHLLVNYRVNNIIVTEADGGTLVPCNIPVFLEIDFFPITNFPTWFNVEQTENYVLMNLNSNFSGLFRLFTNRSISFNIHEFDENSYLHQEIYAIIVTTGNRNNDDAIRVVFAVSREIHDILLPPGFNLFIDFQTEPDFEGGPAGVQRYRFHRHTLGVGPAGNNPVTIRTMSGEFFTFRPTTSNLDPLGGGVLYRGTRMFFFNAGFFVIGDPHWN